MYYDIAPSPDNLRNSEGDTIRLAGGRLLVAWSRFDGSADDARADIYAIETNDDGRTWSEARRLVARDEARQNVMSVSLVRNTAGHVLLFYLRKNGPDDCQIYVRESTDELASLGAQRRVSTRDGYHVMNNARVLRLANGRLLAPAAYTRDWAISRKQTAICYSSNDGGRSWVLSDGEVVLPSSQVGCQEPGLVEIESGLLMCIRTDLGYVYAARSADAGNTWDQPTAVAELASPMSPCTMCRLDDGDLLAVYNHRPDARTAAWSDRTPLSAALSSDDGATWRHLTPIEIDARYCYAYTSLRVYGADLVMTYYVWSRDAGQSFENTALRVRSLPMSRFCEAV